MPTWNMSNASDKHQETNERGGNEEERTVANKFDAFQYFKRTTVEK